MSMPIVGPAPDYTVLDRVNPETFLSLDRFAHIVSYSPILFHQVIIMHNDLQRDSSCSDPVLEYTWQPRGGGRPGRTEIAQAIQQAEDMIYRVLKTTVLPRWFEDEVDVFNTSGLSYGRIGLRTNNFRLIEFGTPVSAYVTTSPIVWTDGDGDEYKERGTITFTAPPGFTRDNISELRVYHPGSGGEATWEIRPIRVEYDGLTGLVDIHFGRHLCVLSTLRERLDAEGVDGMSDANFLTDLDVYRVYNNPNFSGEVIWPCGGCGVCTACTTQSSSVCASIIDPKNGLVHIQPATWGDDGWVPATCAWVGRPARVKLRYRAGYTYDRFYLRRMTDMAPELERAVAFLALSLLDRDWLVCEQIRNLQAHWRFDMAKRESTAAQSTSFLMDNMLLRSPLGTSRAAIYAWRVLQPLLIGEAVLNI